MSAAAGSAPELLDADTVVPWLLDQGLLDTAAIVTADVEVSSAARRNLNLRVERRRGTGFLIKRPDPQASGSRETLGHEARFYELCRRRPEAAPLVSVLPRLRKYFSAGPILVIELVAGGRPLWNVAREGDGGVPPEAARELGRALALLHATFRSPDLRREPLVAGLPAGLPRALTLDRPSPAVRARLSPANQELVRIVQNEQRLAERLADLRALWRAETLIHGDVRADNVLRVEGSGRVRVVDWELIRVGDPAWDVGAALGDFLWLWLQGLPRAPQLDAETRLAGSRTPAARLRAAARAFWEGYLEHGAVGAADLRSRAVRYSAALLIQSAWASSFRRRSLDSLSVLALQVSANILIRPDAAARDLYGLPAAA